MLVPDSSGFLAQQLLLPREEPEQSWYFTEACMGTERSICVASGFQQSSNINLSLCLF